MYIRINDEMWTIRDRHLEGILPDKIILGSCNYTNRVIEIESRQRSRKRLDTLVHEILHALQSDYSEKLVEDMTQVPVYAIWQDKWRRKK